MWTRTPIHNLEAYFYILECRINVQRLRYRKFKHHLIVGAFQSIQNASQIRLSLVQLLYRPVTTNRRFLASHRGKVCRKFESLGLFIMSGNLNIDGGLIDSLSARCTSFVIHLFINNCYCGSSVRSEFATECYQIKVLGRKFRNSGVMKERSKNMYMYRSPISTVMEIVDYNITNASIT